MNGIFIQILSHLKLCIRSDAVELIFIKYHFTSDV